MIDTQTTEQPKRRGRPTNEALAEKKRKVVELAKQRPNISQRAISTEIGIDRSIVSDVLAKYKINQEELEEYKTNQTDVMIGLQHRIAKSITDEDIKKAGLQARLTAFGIIFDKYRTHTGQSNTNIASWTNLVAQSHKAQVIDNAKVAHSTTECDKPPVSD